MSSRLTGSDIVRARLYNQRLAGPQFERPEEVVQWLGAVQSQEYANTKWGIAQRAGSLTDAAIDQAFADGKILRTHVMRPTWHFVVPEDIRWMLALTAPRVHALSAYYHRQQELDAAIFAKSHGLLTKALQGQTQLTRKADQQRPSRWQYPHDRLSARIYPDACRARSAHLQRRIARQAAYLCPAQRASAAGEDTHPR